MAEQEGHEITADASNADVLVVNTCAFIDRAKQESIDTIIEMAELKKQRDGRKLIVTGCLAERYREELKKEIPEIDAVLGTGEVDVFAAALRSSTLSHQPSAHALTFHRKAPVFGVDLPTYIYHADTPRKRVTPGHYAYIEDPPKGVTTSAPSASSRRCAGTIAADRSSRSSRKRVNWRRKA